MRHCTVCETHARTRKKNSKTHTDQSTRTVHELKHTYTHRPEYSHCVKSVEYTPEKRYAGVKILSKVCALVHVSSSSQVSSSSGMQGSRFSSNPPPPAGAMMQLGVCVCVCLNYKP